MAAQERAPNHGENSLTREERIRKLATEAYMGSLLPPFLGGERPEIEDSLEFLVPSELGPINQYDLTAMLGAVQNVHFDAGDFKNQSEAREAVRNYSALAISLPKGPIQVHLFFSQEAYLRGIERLRPKLQKATLKITPQINLN